MGYCSLRVMNQPSVEPVSVEEAANHLRLDTAAPDLEDIVSAARVWAEGYLNRALITQTLRFTMSATPPPATSFGAIINPIIFVAPLSWWPTSGMPIGLPMSPVQSIVGLTQRLADGTSKNLTVGSDYDADATSDPGRVTLRGVGQPIGSDLAITYIAGYGDTAAAVPTTVKHAIKLLTAWLYEHRGDDDADLPPAAVKMLLNPERLVTFA